MLIVLWRSFEFRPDTEPCEVECGNVRKIARPRSVASNASDIRTPRFEPACTCFSPRHKISVEGVCSMKNKKVRKVTKTKAVPVRKKVRRIQPRLVHRERNDLQLKDYLMEDHPELDLPVQS